MKTLIIIDVESGKATTVAIGNMGYQVFEAEQALAKLNNTPQVSELSVEAEREVSDCDIPTLDEPEFEEDTSDCDIPTLDEPESEDEKPEEGACAINIEKEFKILKKRMVNELIKEKQRGAFVSILQKIRDTGYNPSQSMIVNDLRIVSIEKIRNLFGSFEEALKAAGLPKNKRGKAADHLKKAAMIVKLKGSVPKKVKKYKQITHAMVRTAIKRTKNYLGHTPSQAEFKYSKYTISEEAVNSLFGSYEKAVMSAGLVPKSMEPVDATTI